MKDRMFNLLIALNLVARWQFRRPKAARLSAPVELNHVRGSLTKEDRLVKPYCEACEENKQPILAVLGRVFSRARRMSKQCAL